MVKMFRIKGSFKHNSGCQKFTQEIPAISEEQALERIYSVVGSKHKVKRNTIHIEEVVEIKQEKVEDAKSLAVLR